MSPKGQKNAPLGFTNGVLIGLRRLLNCLLKTCYYAISDARCRISGDVTELSFVYL